MTIHYSPGSEPGETACGLRDIPAERIAGDPDPVDCGNCLSSLPWRNAISQRHYKRDYERFHGPGGFLDRAGQTTPASSTTAPQARAAMGQAARRELEHVAEIVRKGAGTDMVAVAVRNSAESIVRAADALVAVALEEDRATAVTRKD